LLEDVLEISIAPMLGAVISLLLVDLLLRIRERKRIKTDFTLLISIFVVGWLFTEILATLGSVPRFVSRFAHLSVLLAFALALTLRWNWALKEAMRSRG